MGGTVIVVSRVLGRAVRADSQYLLVYDSLSSRCELTLSMKWVESDPDENGFGGGGGKQWIEVSDGTQPPVCADNQDNIEAWVNVAGSLLGKGFARSNTISDHKAFRKP